MVVLKDIAERCGVSVATVSKALNDYYDISEETKKRILRMAEEMHYISNSVIQATKMNKTRTIGVLFGEELKDEVPDGAVYDYYAQLLNNLKREIEDQNYNVSFLNSGRVGKRRMSYLEQCRYRNYDGVAIICANFDSEEIAELVRSEIPVVTVDYLFGNTCSVVSDNISGMQELVQYVYGKGHRRIAYIYGEDSIVTRNRLSSFCRTLEELHIPAEEKFLVKGAYHNTEEAYRRTKQLLELQNPPTCIFYPDDFSCFGGMNAIRDKNLRVPEDVSVVGYDGMLLARQIEPMLTTMCQDAERMGIEAGKKLIQMIEHPQTALLEQITIKGKFLEGSTVANLAK